MAYILVMFDRFIIILGLGLIAALLSLVYGGYNMAKLYYYLQMSSDMSRASKLILKVFFYGMFGPMMIIFFANEMALPLLGQPTQEQLFQYQTGQLELVLIKHSLNTGGIYLVLMSVVAVTLALYYLFNKQQKEKIRRREAAEIAKRLEDEQERIRKKLGMQGRNVQQ